MIRQYQALLVLDTTGKEDSVDDMMSAIGKEMEEGGATLKEIDHMGKRKFPYVANKLEAGHYVNVAFEGEPTVIEAIKDRLKLNKDIYIQHYQRA